MILVCPECGKTQDVSPKRLLGNYFVCKYCGKTAQWNRSARSRQVYKLYDKNTQNRLKLNQDKSS